MAHTMWLLFLVFIPMETRLEQRAVIKAFARAGETVHSTILKLQAAWPGHALSTPQIRLWFQCFKDDPNRGTKDCKHTGHHRSEQTVENQAKLEEQLQVEKRSTLRQLANSCSMSKTTVHRVLRQDMNMRKLAPKFVPKVLTPAQMAFRVELCTVNVRTLEADPGILSRIVATDESWIFTYAPRMKFADMELTCPREPHLRKALRG